MAMSKKLYNLMDWAEIEAVTYSEEDHPKAVLGPHMVKGGTLVTAYLPKAKNVTLKIKGSKVAEKMELADEEGYFAVLVKNKYPFDYTFEEEDTDGKKAEFADPYAFDGMINKRDTQKFNLGIHYRAYDILGAKLMSVNGVTGVHFAVWAPNAIRVSVTGTFNGWDGRIHQMERLWDSGIFELFIPGVCEGSLYKYEIKLHNGTVILKSDPYGYEFEELPGTASAVCDIEKFTWKDDKWIEGREKFQSDTAPVAIYELNLDTFADRTGSSNSSGYRDMAPAIAAHVKDMGYTHIELMPVMEHSEDGSQGYHTLGFFAPTRRYGTAEDFMFFIDYMHSNGIGVILDWSPSVFPRDEQGLIEFDGTCLYEDPDGRKSMSTDRGAMYFNLGRNEVKNFLIADALFWVLKYHADGLRVDSVEKMLYLDYGKADGEWVPNIYGGKENLDSVEFFKHLNSVFRKLSGDILMIAEESAVWPNVTGNVEDDSLGFNYRLNNGWTDDVLGYLKYESLYRTHHYSEVCFPMVYQYSENFILPLDHILMQNGNGSLIDRMPGDLEEKYANLRALLSFFMFHPGKKMIFMGNDNGTDNEGNQYKDCVRELLNLYRTLPALSECDSSQDGFEWVNNISANENIVVFIRKSKRKSDTLLVVANFENVPHKEYKIGVPYAGKYMEIFNSDNEAYGGFGFINPKAKVSKKDECDGRDDSIRIKVAPLAVSVFKFGEKQS